MTHGNVVSTVAAVMEIVPGLGNKDIYLAYLPLAHILELAAEVCTVTIVRNYSMTIHLDMQMYSVDLDWDGALISVIK